jgi:hypothetical protein
LPPLPKSHQNGPYLKSCHENKILNVKLGAWLFLSIKNDTIVVLFLVDYFTMKNGLSHGRDLTVTNLYLLN